MDESEEGYYILAEVVKILREYGHEVYDFGNPPHNHGAFMWKDVDPDFD